MVITVMKRPYPHTRTPTSPPYLVRSSSTIGTRPIPSLAASSPNQLPLPLPLLLPLPESPRLDSGDAMPRSTSASLPGSRLEPGDTGRPAVGESLTAVAARACTSSSLLSSRYGS